jgi:replication initiation and membrane attachment protein
MTFIWNELRPHDRYRVHLANSLSLFQIKALTHLYQPLMGSVAYSLYLTLMSEVEGDRHFSIGRNHQWLMNVMSNPLDKIYRARLRLEALGLVKTFILQKEDHQDTLFEYELFIPLSPEQFFADDILSICLYNQVGAHRYKALRAQYSAYAAQEDVEFEVPKKDVTKEFHEVFSSIHPSELMALQGTEIYNDLQQIEKEHPLSTTVQEQNNPQYERYKIDIDLLKGLFIKGINADALLSPENLIEIKKIAFFYQFDEWNLSRIIQDSLTIGDEIDLAIFREKAKEWYRLQHDGKPPKVIHLIQPISQRIYKESELNTEEEKHLYRLETISPLELLKAYQGGKKIADADVKLVEELLFDYDLYPSVVNLLIEYILLTNDFKLPKNLVTKVAAHWKRLKVTDIKKAQDLAKKEHQQYKQWKENSKVGNKDSKEQKTSTRPKQGSPSQVKKDTLPKWIEEQAQDEKTKKEDPGQATSISEQEKRERMKALLEALGEWDEKGGE